MLQLLQLENVGTCEHVQIAAKYHRGIGLAQQQTGNSEFAGLSIAPQAKFDTVPINSDQHGQSMPGCPHSGCFRVDQDKDILARTQLAIDFIK